MNAEELTGLLRELISELEGESAEIKSGEMELLEKRGSNIEKIMAKLQEADPSVSDAEVLLLVEKASRIRKENTGNFRELMQKTQKEMNGVRRGKEVCRAYNPDAKQQELFVKKDC